MTPRENGSGPRRGRKQLRAIPTERRTFVEYLKFIRLNRGLTQTQVARGVGISQGAYCDIERGQKKPRPRTYPRLADILQVPVEELVSRIHKLNPDRKFR